MVVGRLLCVMYLGQVRGSALAPAFWGIAAGYRESPDTTASRCRGAAADMQQALAPLGCALA